LKIDGITGWIKSDHVLNLLGEVDGRLPVDKERYQDNRQYFALGDEESLSMIREDRVFIEVPMISG
jgi:hypothetical protein